MNKRYPFRIRHNGKYSNTFNKIIEADSYRNALNKVLALFPAKRVLTKHAKNMDLISARVEAAKASKTKGKTYVNLVDDGETEVSQQAGNEVLAVYVNGSEVKIEPSSNGLGKIATKTVAAVNKLLTNNKLTKNNMNSKKTIAKKTAPKKVAKKVEAVKNTASSKKVEAPVKVAAGQKLMTIKAIREHMKKGFFALNKDGKNLTPKYLEEMADQSREILVSFVAKTK